jgi:hypothetical protein
MSDLLKPKHLRARVLGGAFCRLRMDALARKFHETHDMKLKDEIERLAVRAMLTELDKSGLAVP